MMSAREFSLPDLGEGLTEAEIVRWLVAVGDSVAVDQPVVEVETAKAAVEVPSPFSGTVTATHGEPGDVVAVGSPLLAVSMTATASQSARGLPPASPAPASPPPGSPPTERQAMAEVSGSVLVGYGTGTSVGRRRAARAAGPAAVGASATAGPARGRPGTRTAVVSPLVRRLAREHGVDVATLAGSGPDGLVLRADVQRAIMPPLGTPPPSTPPLGTPPLGTQHRDLSARPTNAPAEVARTRGVDAAEPAERVPLRGGRLALADKLTRSRREIPEVTTWVDVDATELLAARDAMHDRERPRIGVLALIARFVVTALGRFPDLNAQLDMARAEIVRKPFVHLGFAAHTGRALVVPVVRDAHQLTTEQLAAQISRLTEAARSGVLTPAELTGGTFTINNFGVFGVDGATPIINQPEVAMLGVGRIAARPWVVDGELRVRQVAQLSLTFDHRVCDGGVAAGFLRLVADCVERPVRSLREL